jgi:hypothetical protein
MTNVGVRGQSGRLLPPLQKLNGGQCAWSLILWILSSSRSS